MDGFNGISMKGKDDLTFAPIPLHGDDISTVQNTGLHSNTYLFNNNKCVLITLSVNAISVV